MTQLEAARKGIVTEAMKIVAADEGLDAEAVRAAVATGEAVIPLNIHHANCHPVGVGRMFTTKINANLGRSVTHSGKGDELEKLRVALDAGADFVMDLSVGSDDLKAIRQGMLDASPKPLGTVPVYETISRLEGDIPQMDPSFLLDVIRAQAEQGVDFMTLHAGLLLRHIPPAMTRVMGIVSRGGAIMAEWMMEHQVENPLYTHWDEVLAILAAHDVTVSLGDGMRPGCLEERGAVGRRRRRANGAHDVVVAGRDVGRHGAEDVERRLPADLLLALHVHLDLAERDVSRALHHDLYAALAATLDELAKHVKLSELGAYRRDPFAGGAGG